MSVSNQMEFSVEMHCNSCAKTVQDVLRTNGISVVSIDISKEQVVVKSLLSSFEIKEILESTGKKAALVGSGKLGAAVVEINSEAAKGVVRLSQLDEEQCLIEGVLDGLTPGKHKLNIHEFGDLTDGCKSCGDVFNPFNYLIHKRQYGNIGSVVADKHGRAKFLFIDGMIKVWDVIGRSMVVHKCNESSSLLEKVSAVGCAIIARSSGVFQNTKKLCTCDGISIWDERNVPVVGVERQEFMDQQKH